MGEKEGFCCGSSRRFDRRLRCFFSIRDFRSGVARAWDLSQWLTLCGNRGASFWAVLWSSCFGVGVCIEKELGVFKG